jgi:hypothetical protein
MFLSTHLVSWLEIRLSSLLRGSIHTLFVYDVQGTQQPLRNRMAPIAAFAPQEAEIATCRPYTQFTLYCRPVGLVHALPLKGNQHHQQETLDKHTQPLWLKAAYEVES